MKRDEFIRKTNTSNIVRTRPLPNKSGGRRYNRPIELNPSIITTGKEQSFHIAYFPDVKVNVTKGATVKAVSIEDALVKFKHQKNQGVIHYIHNQSI